MTPIGALAFWPVALLVKAGSGIGMAIIWSQVITALVFLPIVIWVGWSRLSPWVAALFGLCVMVLLLSLVHGEAARAVSISMHYNRLAWAAAFVAIVAALIPPPQRIDGRFGWHHYRGDDGGHGDDQGHLFRPLRPAGCIGFVHDGAAAHTGRRSIDRFGHDRGHHSV